MLAQLSQQHRLAVSSNRAANWRRPTPKKEPITTWYRQTMKLKTDRTLLRLETKATMKITADFRLSVKMKVGSCRTTTKTKMIMTAIDLEEEVAVAAEVVEVAEVVGVVVAAKAVKAA